MVATEGATAGKRYWGMKLGEGGKYVDLGRRGNYIAIGFRGEGSELPDLSEWASKAHAATWWEELKDFYKAYHLTDSPMQIAINAGQVRNFAVEMSPGDLALVPDSARRVVCVAEISGGYEYVPSPTDGCPYVHRRIVAWLREVDRSKLPEKLKTSLGALQTIFSLDKHSDAIEALLGGKPPSPLPEVTVTDDELVKALIDRLLEMGPSDFETFVGHVFTLAGFSTIVTQPAGDKGVDVIGTLNAEGLAEISLKIQVKRIKANIGIGEILGLRGTLEQEEQGVLVTLGSFTKQAVEETEHPRKKPIRLLDGEALVDLVLRHYDELDPKYRQYLQIERRDVPLREQFVTKVKRA